MAMQNKASEKSMAEQKIRLSRKYLQDYVNRFEKAYSSVVFERQESGFLHNTLEWGEQVYGCLLRHDIDGMLEALNTVGRYYNPGKLSK